MKQSLLFLGSFLLAGLVNAQVYEIGNAKTQIKLNSNNVADSFVQEANLAIPVYKIESYYDVENRTCTRVECQEEEVNQNPTWNGFFTTSSNIGRAKILSESIKGIGLATAEKIVSYNLILARPTSWSNFVNLIKFVENELFKRGHQHSFTKEVTELYGYDNAQSLGYFLATVCRDISYSCQITVEKQKKVFAYNINKSLTVNYSGKGSNTHLYPFEADEIEITTEGSGETKVVLNTGYNTYQNEVKLLNQGASILVNIKAGNRNLVSAPSSMFTVSTQFGANGADLKIITLGTYASFLTSSNNIEVTYQVCSKKGMSWTKSECNSPINSGSFKLTQTEQKLSVPFGFSSGAKYYVTYNIKLLSSNDFKLGTLAQGASNTYKAP